MLTIPVDELATPTMHVSEVLVLAVLLSLVVAATVALVGLRALVVQRPARRGDCLANPQRQMEAVSAVQFEVTPILSEEERGLFQLIEAALGELAPGLRLLARVSLDEVVRPRDASGRDWDRVMASIRSKRLDFAIFDGTGRIVAALGCTARARLIGEGRDRVRRAALERAGVPYIALDPDMRAEELCVALSGVLGGHGHMAPARPDALRLETLQPTAA